jgi:pimeloyl-ACP methyl ester carboxylesterase
VSLITYQGAGTSGPPIVLVHGFPVDAGMWHGQLAGLGGVARVVAPDLPGFGGSAPGPAGMADYADAVVALANALGFQRFVLGGLSMGGYVAFAAARAHRERLLGLILCDTRAEPDTPESVQARMADADRALREGTAAYIERLLDLVGASGPARAELERMMRAVAPASFAAALRGIALRPDARPELPGLDLPVLCLVGADDRITPPDGMRAMAAAIPHATFEIVPGGHAAPLEHPAEANAAIARFLSRL